jgi:outer membrane immunogenic protein
MKNQLITSAALTALFFGSAAMAADMPVKAPIYKAPPAAVYSWTGCYIGGNAGGKSARTEGDVSVPASTFTPAGTASLGSDRDTTWVAGGQIGCNYQSGQFVFGIEGDIDANRWSTTQTLGGALTGAGALIPGDFFTADSRWQASVRGRLGYAWDRTLLYATGGVAFADVDATANYIAVRVPTGVLFPASMGSERRTLVGFTVGGGVEYALQSNWSVGVEGRYTWYQSHDFSGGPLAASVTGGTVAAPVFQFVNTTQNLKLDTAEVLFKLNYKLGGLGFVQ